MGGVTIDGTGTFGGGVNVAAGNGRFETANDGSSPRLQSYATKPLYINELGNGMILGGTVTFATDNSFDIGASGANRPRNLYVAGTGTFGGAVQVSTLTANGGLPHILAQSTSSASYASMRLYNNLNTGIRALEIDYAGTAYGGSLITSSPVGESGAIYTTGNYPLSFGQNAAERFRLDTSGGVAMNTDLYYVVDNTYDFGAPSSNRARNIYAAGTIYSASSRTLKKGIRTSTLKALELVRKLRLVDYRYKKAPDTQMIGFIAEEAPELLSGKSRKDFNLNNAVGILLKAVQELGDRLAVLEPGLV
jgi:hypothetical protein